MQPSGGGVRRSHIWNSGVVVSPGVLGPSWAAFLLHVHLVHSGSTKGALMPKKYDGEVLLHAVWIGKSREPWMLLEAVVLYDGVDEAQRVCGRVALRMVGAGINPYDNTSYTFSQSLWRMRTMVEL